MGRGEQKGLVASVTESPRPLTCFGVDVSLQEGTDIGRLLDVFNQGSSFLKELMSNLGVGDQPESGHTAARAIESLLLLFQD